MASNLQRTKTNVVAASKPDASLPATRRSTNVKASTPAQKSGDKMASVSVKLGTFKDQTHVAHPLS